jgi:hypothetical protein
MALAAICPWQDRPAQAPLPHCQSLALAREVEVVAGPDVEVEVEVVVAQEVVPEEARGQVVLEALEDPAARGPAPPAAVQGAAPAAELERVVGAEVGRAAAPDRDPVPEQVAGVAREVGAVRGPAAALVVDQGAVRGPVVDQRADRGPAAALVVDQGRAARLF